MLNRKQESEKDPILGDYDSMHVQDVEVSPTDNGAPGDILAQYENFSSESRGGWETSEVSGQEW